MARLQQTGVQRLVQARYFFVCFLAFIGLFGAAVFSCASTYQLWPVVVGASGSTLSGNGYQLQSCLSQSSSYYVSDSSHSVRIGFLNSFSNAGPMASATATPTPGAAVTPTASPTSIADFLPDKLTVYCAPNPIRGTMASLNIFTNQGAEVHVKMYTVANQFVMSFDRTYGSAGRHVETFYVGNLANGVYLILVTTKNADGSRDRLIYKCAFVK